MPKKDYYEILGIKDTATNEEIRNVYRSLAKKYHPDVNKGNAQAESRFKEISEAYNVLKDPEKRKKYDQMKKYGAFGGGPSGGGFDFGQFWQQGNRGQRGGGSSTFDDLFGFGGLGDIFGDIFDFGGRGRKEKSRSNTNEDQLHSELTIPFELAVKGGKQVINVTLEETCSSCNGTGSATGTKPIVCPECKGRGNISIAQGFFSVNRPCPNCYGRGTIIEKPCPACHGIGEAKRTKKLAVTIPPGIEDGSKLKLRGQGASRSKGGAKGDIILTFHVSPHRFFKRKGNDIYCEVPVDIIKAIKGTKLRVNSVYGKKLEIKVPAGTKNGKTFRLKGFGVKSNSSTGDQYVKIKVNKRSNLSNEEKKIVEDFENNGGVI